MFGVLFIKVESNVANLGWIRRELDKIELTPVSTYRSSKFDQNGNSLTDFLSPAQEDTKIHETAQEMAQRKQERKNELVEDLLGYDRPGLVSFAKKLSKNNDSDPINFGLNKKVLDWRNYKKSLF